MDSFSFQWQLRTKINFGINEFNNIGQYAASLGRNALLVTGKSSLKKSGKLDEALKLLSAAGVNATVFSGIEENPRLDTLQTGTAIAKEKNCDLVIAIGGGSTMDAAKAIALELTTNDSCWNYIAIHDDKKAVPQLSVPLMLVPTMNATGSETNGNAVITNEEVNEKSPLSDPNLAPDIALIDPQLTTTLPWRQTSYTLMDATSHILEPYVSALYDVPMSAHITEGILKSIIQAGQILKESPDDLGARCNLAWAGSMACCNIPNLGLDGYRYCHHVEHVMGAYTDIAHALGLAIIIPRWMKLFEDEMADTLMELAPIYGTFESFPETPNEVIIAFTDWLDTIGLKTSLSEEGITDTSLAGKMAESLLAIPNLRKKFSEGRTPMDQDKLTQLYEMCF